MHLMVGEAAEEIWNPAMVQQLKFSVWTAAISSSAGIGQPIAFNSLATIPIIAALFRFLSEVIWQSLPGAWRGPHRLERR